MNSKVLTAGLIGSVMCFFLGYLFYGNLVAGMISDASMPGFQRPMEEFRWPFLILSNLACGFFVAYVFSRWATISTFAGGLQGGAMLGLFLGLIYNFAFHATTNMMTLQGHIVDIITTIVITALVGGVVGWWLGRK